MKSARRSRYQPNGHKSEPMTTSSICFEFTSLIAAKRSARPFRCVSAPANSTLNRPELLAGAFLRSTSGEPNGAIKHCFCAHASGGSDSRINPLEAAVPRRAKTLERAIFVSINGIDRCVRFDFAQPIRDFSIQLAKNCIDAKCTGFMFRSESHLSNEQANHFPPRNGARARSNCRWKGTALQNFAEPPRQSEIDRRFGIPAQGRPEFA